MEAGLSTATEDDIYEVERILKKRKHPTKGILYYVKWRGFPNSENTWEPAGNFSRKLIRDYESGKRNESKRQKLSTTNKTSARTTTIEPSILSLADRQLVPSSSSSITSSYTSDTESKLAVFNPVGGHSLSVVSREIKHEVSSNIRPKKNTTLYRQQQVQVQMHIQQRQKAPIGNQEFAVFNPIGSHSLPVIDEVVYEPALTKEPIMVTDVTAQDLTVTISECAAPDGFFSA